MYETLTNTNYFQAFAKKLPELHERLHELEAGHVIGDFLKPEQLQGVEVCRESRD
jgi:hypothetical protein